MTDCPRCGPHHETLREAFKKSLFLTAKILCGFNKTNYEAEPSESFHLPLCTWIEDSIRNGDRRLLVMVPRDHLKTSVITIGATVWMLINDPSTRAFVMHKGASYAQDMIGQVQEILLSEDFKHWFPELVPQINRKGIHGKKPRWNEYQIEIPRPRYHMQASVTALGLESTVESSHVHAIILDDLVDRRTSQSPALMERACEFRKHVAPLFENAKRGLLIVVGTYWPGGFYEEILEEKYFKKLVVGCYQDSRSEVLGLSETGKPLWTENYSTDELLAIEDEMGHYRFAHQYLNDPVSRAAATFKIEDLKYFEWNPTKDGVSVLGTMGQIELVPVKDMKLTMTVDPSGAAATGDDTAITVLGYHHASNRIFLLDWYAEPSTPRKAVEQIFKIAGRWGIKNVGIEKTAYRDMLMAYLRQQQKEHSIRLNVVDLRPKNQSKPERIIEGFQAFVESHRFYLRDKDKKVINQMVRWNPERENQQDDILDSLAYHTQLWQYKTARDMRRDIDGIPIDEDNPRRQKIRENAPAYGLGDGGRRRWHTSVA